MHKTRNLFGAKMAQKGSGFLILRYFFAQIAIACGFDRKFYKQRNAKAHDAGHGLHDNGRDAHFTDGFDIRPIQLEVLQTKLNILVFGQVEIHAQQHGNDLADDRGNGCAFSAHSGQTEMGKAKETAESAFSP